MSEPLTSVPFIDMSVVNAPYREDLRAAFERVLDSCEFAGGSEIEGFEAELAQYVGVRHALGVNSGTAALLLGLQAAGVGQGDEVIVPANTFFATAQAVVEAGATPVLVDVDPDTALMNPDATQAAITARTAAIIPVHLYGNAFDADRFRDISERHSLLFMEDNAQAIGGSWDAKPTGSLGDIAAFSFYPGKNLGALGEGGAITTNNETLAHRVALLRNHGSQVKYHHEEWGWNERLHGMQAAFLRVKLADITQAQAKRDHAVSLYRSLLEHHEEVTWFQTHPKARHVWHLLVVQVAQRDHVVAEMATAGIGVGIHYPIPIHLQAAGISLGKEGQFPVSERLAKSIVSLPLFSGITDAQVERSATTLVNIIERSNNIGVQ